MSMIFIPIGTFQKNEFKIIVGAHFQPSNEPFYVTKGFIEQIDKELSIDKIEDKPSESSNTAIETLTAPQNVQIVEVIKDIDIKTNKNKSSIEPTISQEISLQKSYINPYLLDHSLWFKNAIFTQYSENGNPTGISISGISSQALFRRMGLRNGDIIVGLDNKEIINVKDTLEIINVIETRSSFILYIRTKGIKKRLAYRIR